MTCSTINWAKLLLAECNVKTDISFSINNDIEIGDNENEKNKFIKAHKLILAAISPVFEKMFYGPMKETREVIPIEDSTEYSFQCLIDIIYKKEINSCNLESKSFTTLFEIMYLAEKYQIKEIFNIISEKISHNILNDMTVMDVAAVAETYTQFEVVSKSLFNKCVLHIDKMLETKDDIIKLLEDDTDNKIDIHLFKRILIAIGKSTCKNCKKHIEECLDGKEIKEEKVRSGIRAFGDPNQMYPTWTRSNPVIFSEFFQDTRWHVKTSDEKLIIVHINDHRYNQFRYCCK